MQVRQVSFIEEITQHLKDRAINVMSTLKRAKELSDKQRKDAITIIDIIVKNFPEFFDQVDNSKDQEELKKSTASTG